MPVSALLMGLILAAGASAQPAAPAGASDPNAVLQEAGLQAPDLQQLGWSAENIKDLASAIQLASKATRELLSRTSNASGDFWKSGTMANIDGSLRGDMSRGCVEFQAAVRRALTPLNGSSLDVSGVSVGAGLEHHAVIVFPKDADARPHQLWKQRGIVLDGWLNQSAKPREMTYLFQRWGGGARFPIHRLISGANLE